MIVTDLEDTISDLYVADSPDGKAMGAIVGEVFQISQRKDASEIEDSVRTVQTKTKSINDTLWCLRHKYEVDNRNQQLKTNPNPQQLLDKYQGECNKGRTVKGDVAHIIKRLQKYVEAFAKEDSPFRHQALLTAPMLIELSLIAPFLNR